MIALWDSSAYSAFHLTFLPIFLFHLCYWKRYLSCCQKTLSTGVRPFSWDKKQNFCMLQNQSALFNKSVYVCC